MTDDFVIDQVSWHTQIENTETADHVRARFFALARFLDENGLTRSSLPQEIDDTFAVRSSDLTEIGLRVMKKGYDTWLRALDAGASVDDVRILQKALARISKSA